MSTASCVRFVDGMILSGGGVRMKQALQRPGQKDEGGEEVTIWQWRMDS